MHKVYKLSDEETLEKYEGSYYEYFVYVVGNIKIKITNEEAYRLLSQVFEKQRNKLALMAKWEPVDNVNAKIKDIVGDDYKAIFGKEYYGCDLKDLNYLRQANSTYRDSM